MLHIDPKYNPKKDPDVIWKEITKDQLRKQIGLALDEWDIGEDDCGDRDGLYKKLVDHFWNQKHVNFYSVWPIIQDYTEFYDDTSTDYTKRVIEAVSCIYTNNEYDDNFLG